MSLIGEAAPGKAPADLIKDGADASFVADVMEASREGPVIVDFWATWCGPCKQLTPLLEKAVLAAKGAVKMVKIDIDKNPAIAGQLRVQSVPTVLAFVDGRPADGFTGAVPESQVKAFVDKLAKLAGPKVSPTAALIEEAKRLLALGDTGGAAAAFAEALKIDPANLAAIGGLARCYLAGGDAKRAGEVAAMAPAGAKHPDLESVRAALALAATAPKDAKGLEGKVAANPDNHQARLDLATALAAKGDFQGAADHLLTLIERDRDWNDGAGRKQLLTVFEAAGGASQVARDGRRRLSSILFT
ncbi:MAG TPA: tetratricopeptide repeat protein [Caulobacteraceae bacterium]